MLVKLGDNAKAFDCRFSRLDCPSSRARSFSYCGSACLFAHCLLSSSPFDMPSCHLASSNASITTIVRHDPIGDNAKAFDCRFSRLDCSSSRARSFWHCGSACLFAHCLLSSLPVDMPSCHLAIEAAKHQQYAGKQTKLCAPVSLSLSLSFSSRSLSLSLFPSLS